MSALGILPLMAVADWMQLDILFWLIALPLVVLLLVVLIWQQRQYRTLQADRKILDTVNHRTIEYDLVLKAMKLAVWHIDVQERTITYDSDYRDTLDIPPVPPGSDVELFCNNLLPEDKKRIAARMVDLVEGRTDHVHEQYQSYSSLDGTTTWGET